MCGISGVYSPANPLATGGIEAAHRTMRHRGPDDEGFVAFQEGRLVPCRGQDSITECHHFPFLESIKHAELVLGHRRLSIIDLSPAGHQPLVHPSGRFAIVFNGEIYNYLELRSELKALGVEFFTHTDTEVVINSYVQWGKAAFARFNGMWALALWDSQEQSLLLCRDRFGVKPLYYTERQKAVYFASEMKVLRAWPGLHFEPNRAAMDVYLNSCLLNHGSETFWDDILEVLPGHWMEWGSDSRVVTNCYWPYSPEIGGWTYDDALDRFGELFEDSLRLRMRSDVEVGTLLSGGLDSNTIVCALHRLGLIHNGTFKSFSAVFDDQRFSEEQYIRATLRRVPLEPHFIYPRAGDLRDDFPRLLDHLEEPFRSLSVYSQFKIYEHMHQTTQVRVVLNGQGADELFAGYSYHYSWMFSELAMEGHFLRLTEEVRRYRQGRGISFFGVASGVVSSLLHRLRRGDSFSQRLFNELKVSPLREYLKYDDRTSMSASVEARAPFLDYRLVEFAYSLPLEFKMFEFNNKRLERDYARGIVPPEIVQRKDKMGFISPQEVWQRQELEPWLDETFSDLSNLREWMPVARAVSDYRDYRSGRSHAWAKVWRYFCLAQWLQHNGIRG